MNIPKRGEVYMSKGGYSFLVEAVQDYLVHIWFPHYGGIRGKRGSVHLGSFDAEFLGVAEEPLNIIQLIELTKGI